MSAINSKQTPLTSRPEPGADVKTFKQTITHIDQTSQEAGPVVASVISDYFLFDRFAYCPSCGDPEGFFLPAEVYPYFPDGCSVQCTTCGAYDPPASQ